MPAMEAQHECERPTIQQLRTRPAIVADGCTIPWRTLMSPLLTADEERERGSDIKKSREEARPSDRREESFAALDFITHNRGELQANQAKQITPKEFKTKRRIRWDRENPPCGMDVR